jgi:hypothetical protein
VQLSGSDGHGVMHCMLLWVQIRVALSFGCYFFVSATCWAARLLQCGCSPLTIGFKGLSVAAVLLQLSPDATAAAVGQLQSCFSRWFIPPGLTQAETH